MAFQAARIREELTVLVRFLPSFARNPVDGIRRAPNLSWQTMATLQVALALASGVCVGLISLSVANLLLGILVFPITSLLQTAVIGFFLSNWYAILHSTFLDKKRLFGLVILANIPYLLIHVLSGIAPPLDLIGFAMTCGLLIVGLHEHFRIERRQLFRLVGGIYAVFFLVWCLTQLRHADRLETVDELSRPRPLDELEGDIKKAE